MPTRRTKEIPAVKYDAENDRRADDRPPDAKVGLLFRGLKPTEILAALLLAALLLGATGWRWYSVTGLEARVARIEVLQLRMLDIMCKGQPVERACKEPAP